jgi:hypothetical protein
MFMPFSHSYKRREIERAALDPAVAGKARKGDFVRGLDHFKLLQSPVN